MVSFLYVEIPSSSGYSPADPSVKKSGSLYSILKIVIFLTKVYERKKVIKLF
jgi:hypothetical protein